MPVKTFDFRAFLATNIMGSFAFDKNGKLLDKKLFRKDPTLIAERLTRAKMGEIIPEEEEILKNLISCGFKEVIWDKKNTTYKGISCVFYPENIATKILRDEFRKMALDLRWAATQSEINDMLSKINVLVAKGEIKKVRKDEIIIQAIRMYDEIVKQANTFSERLKEWYGLHFPELAENIKENEKYAEIILSFGRRDKIKNSGINIENSAGMEFTDDDIKEVQVVALCVTDLYNAKASLESYLTSMCNRTVPNLSAIAGHLLAARLLSVAGGLEKIAKMPSSTIQLLGAEKALFRHMKNREKSRSPKYGIIFAHPYIQNAPGESKGKVARIIAASLSLAAKTDFFSKEDKGEEIKRQMDEEIRKAGIKIGTLNVK